MGPLDLHFELHYDGVWNDITGDARVRQDVAITQGRQDEASQASPSACNLQLNNRHGRYSPRNPVSPLYGKIGRNTPLRVRHGAPDTSLTMPGLDGSYVSTPDQSSLDITGDLDVRVDVEPDSWRPEEFQILVTKWIYLVAVEQTSWSFYMQPDGRPRFAWTPDGSHGSRITEDSTVSIAEDVGRLALRVTLDVDNGAGGSTLTFYTAPTIAGPWTQLGDPTVNGVTSVFSGSADLVVGADNRGTGAYTDGDPFAGRFYSMEFRDGIDGTLVAAPDFTALVAGDREFADSVGLPWSINGHAVVGDNSVRFSGEVSAWPTRWDLSGNDVWVPVTASGISRRLSQGASPLSSALRRGITGGNVTTPVAYWPCEDDKGATSFGSALDHEPMRFLGDTNAIKPASFSEIASSLPIPTVSTGGRFQGDVPAYPDSDYARGMALAIIPDGGLSSEQNLMRMRTTGGSTEAWFLNIKSTGSLRLVCYAHGGATLVDQSVAFDLNGARGLIWIYLIQNGADVDWEIGFGGVDAPNIGIFDDTLIGHSFGRVHQMIIGQNFDLNNVAVGHVQVMHTNEFWEILQFAKAWKGDAARDRISRLAAEESIPVSLDGGDTEQVGPQRPLPFLDLMAEAADTDLGALIDRRDFLGLHFRSRGTLYNQVPALTLDYAMGEVSAPFEPVEDDQDVRNDLTVSRTEGSSARAVQTVGPLSVSPPPLGVGRYDTAVAINAFTDTQLPDQAGWRLHLGTVDEARYPMVTVDLFANPHLIDIVKRVKIGDRLVVTNPPPWLPPDMIDLIVQGYREVLNAFVWTVTFNCSPGSPWRVGVLDDDVLGRADTAGSETVEVFEAGVATTLVVSTTVGPTWTTDPADWPLDVRVSGVVLTVTGIDGAVADNFARTETSGWGTVDSGQVWTTSGGDPSDFSVEGV